MRNYFKVLLVAIFILPTILLKANGEGEKDPIEGRWDLTVNFEGRVVASWLEVRHTGINGYIGRFVW